MQKIGFSDSGYVIKPPQPSSAVYGASPFTGHQKKRWGQHVQLMQMKHFVWVANLRKM